MKISKIRFLRLFRTHWPIPLLLFLVIVFFWKFFLKGEIPIPGDFVVGVYYPWLDYKWGFEVGVPVKNPLTTDVVSFTYPMQTLAVDLLKEGKLPLWNPYILGGTPLLANFQSAPFSPTNFIYFLTDKLSAWSLQVALQHFLAALFTYLLLRHWKVSKTSSVLGGIMYAFFGFNLIWSQWNGHALAASFIPLILLFESKWLTDGNVRDGIGISISFALLFLSGYPQVALYLLLAVFIYWIVFTSRQKTFLIRSLLLGLFFLIGVGLSAFQVVPGAELLSLSQRAVEPHPFEWAFLPWSKVITFVAPDFFGNHATANYWGPQDYTSNTGFVGVVGLTLATAGLLVLKKKKEVLFLAILLVASLVFAFPTPVSIFLWKSGILGLNAASAHRSLVLFNLSVAALSGFGLDNILRKKSFEFKIFMPSFLILTGFGIFAVSFYFLSKTNPTAYEPLVRNISRYVVAIRNLIFPTATLIAASFLLWLLSRIKNGFKVLILITLFALTSFELFRFGWKFTPFSPRHIVFPRTPIIDYLMSQIKPFRTTGSRVIPINMRMPYEVESFEGYDAVYPLRTSELVAAINSSKSGTDPVGRYGTIDNLTLPLMEMMNTRYYLAIKRDERGNPSPSGNIPSEFLENRFKLVYEDKSVAVLESDQALPRAFLVYDWERKDEKYEIIDTLLAPDFSYKDKILIEDFKKDPQGSGEDKVSFEFYSENESILEVETSKNGLLFISDTFYPGWRAFIDGRETQIYRANYDFRAIEVAEGIHSIKFVYLPESFFNGLKISLISLIILLSLPFYHLLNKRS